MSLVGFERLRWMVCLLPGIFFLTSCGMSVTKVADQTTYAFPAAHTERWAVEFGSNTATVNGLAGDSVTSLTVAPGLLAVAGYTRGVLPGVNPPAGKPANFGMAFDLSGTVRWPLEFGTSASDFIQAAVLDAAGHLMLGGATYGTYPGYANNPGTQQAVVHAVSASGTLLWSTQFQVGGTDASVYRLHTLSNGVIVAIGLARDTAQGSQDVFVAWLDPVRGNVLTTRVYGSSATDTLSGSAISATDAILITGSSSGIFPGGMQAVDSIPFVASLSATGDVNWVQTFASQRTANVLQPAAVAVNSSGAVIVGGAVGPTNAPIGEGILAGINAGPLSQAFLSTLDASTGQPSWFRTYSSGAGDQIVSLATTGDGSIYSAGITNGRLAPGFDAGKGYGFVAKTNAQGDPVWAQQFSIGTFTNALIAATLQVAADTAGNLYCTGPTDAATGSNPSRAVEVFLRSFGPQ